MTMITGAEAEDIVRRYVGGESGTSIAQSTGRSDCGVYGVLRRAGVTIRPYDTEARRIHSLDESYFDVIDTPEKAYWLGFLVADGCVKQNRVELHINLQVSDQSHLERLRQAMKATTEVKHHQSKDRTPVVSFLVRSSHLCESLIRHGVFPRKSMVQVPPGDLPWELRPHYIRGYFDGNGSIHGHGPQITWSMVGSSSLLEWIAASISDACGFSVAHPRKAWKQALLEMKGAGKLTTLRTYLYPASDVICLERKRERFSEVRVRSEKRVVAWRNQQGDMAV